MDRNDNSTPPFKPTRWAFIKVGDTVLTSEGVSMDVTAIDRDTDSGWTRVTYADGQHVDVRGSWTTRRVTK